MQSIFFCVHMHMLRVSGGMTMPRGMKCRRVCCEPENIRFTPDCGNNEFILLSIEELESIRLCDLESMDQDKAASLMNISRGTLQRILYSAHKKVAEALCRGREIHIDGGHFELSEARCKGKKECSHCRFRRGEMNSKQGDAEDDRT